MSDVPKCPRCGGSLLFVQKVTQYSTMENCNLEEKWAELDDLVESNSDDEEPWFWCDKCEELKWSEVAHANKKEG